MTSRLPVGNREDFHPVAVVIGSLDASLKRIETTEAICRLPLEEKTAGRGWEWEDLGG